jgi:hypothetical protein
LTILGTLAGYVLVVLAACSLISGTALVVAWVWRLVARKDDDEPGGGFG